MEWLPPDFWKYLLAPVAGALIGWFTNHLAVKMLFHPRRPVKVGPVTVQGVFPKRQRDLAARLGEMIDRELVSTSDMVEALKDADLGPRLRDTLDEYVDRLLREKLTQAVPMAAMFLGDSTVDRIKAVLVPEMEKMIPDLLDRAGQELTTCYDVSQVVRDKVESFSIEKLEDILFAIMKREFRFIELVGGLLGLAIGIFQSLLFALAG
ncbi:DUF445 domain-containing protein [Desulfohalovibrio reitneri]|uniref:DUF445 domain-containing protein n=1 Tax=Desulfohalovibrio reitneri TaxID=1307759 RepID=UPI0004A72D8B|nr:DUF445 family protein [Desulfohalovibrio reitneri]